MLFVHFYTSQIFVSAIQEMVNDAIFGLV